ncbi:MAG: Tricarboxylate transport protein TctC, partial [uncultured Acetobacteraceae bacterium]
AAPSPPARRLHGHRGPRHRAFRSRCGRARAAALRFHLHVRPRRAGRRLGRARPRHRASGAGRRPRRQLPVRERGRRRRLRGLAALRGAAARAAGQPDGGGLRHGGRDAHQQDAGGHQGRDADRAADGGGERGGGARVLRHPRHQGLLRRAEGQPRRDQRGRRLGGRHGPHRARLDAEGARALGEGGVLRGLRGRRPGAGGDHGRAGQGGHLRPFGVRRADQGRPDARAGHHGGGAHRPRHPDAEGKRGGRGADQLARRVRPARPPPRRARGAGAADDRDARPAGLEGNVEHARLGRRLPRRAGAGRLPGARPDANGSGAEGDRAGV